MSAELTEHLGYDPHQEPPGGTNNARNGTPPKTLVTEHGPVAIQAPRDRKSTFAPQIVRKGQRRFEGCTTRSWRCIRAGCRSETSRRTWPRSTA
jgi:transposase-like protein